MGETMKVWVLMHEGRQGVEAICAPGVSNILLYEPVGPVPKCPVGLPIKWVEVDLTFSCQHTMACSKCGALP